MSGAATLAQLGIELTTAMAAEDAARKAWLPIYEAGRGNDDTPELDRLDRAYEAVSGIIDQIAAIPAAGLPDLRVKALAMDWHNRTVEKPDDFWTMLGAEIVAGLLAEGAA